MMTKATVFGMAAVLLGAAGCSEAVPPASEGAFRANWASSGGTCRIDSNFTAAIGLATDKEIELIKDTADGATIFCAVVAAGDGFDVEGELRHPNGVNVEFNINGLRADATAMNPALGTMSFSSFETQGQYVSPPEELCRFWFTGDQEIAAGRAWMQFGCTQLLDAGSTCGIQDNSTIAIQNCDQ